jgi:ElaB/YqjD/DUF883 family membrane-anchored ribosome-binding protein
MTTRQNQAAQAEQESRLVDPIKDALDQAEDLLRQAAAVSGEQAEQLREQALATLRRSRLALHDVQDSMLDRGRAAARLTDDYVHDRPWQAATIAGVAGLLLGLLIARR